MQIKDGVILYSDVYFIVGGMNPRRLMLCLTYYFSFVYYPSILDFLGGKLGECSGKLLPHSSSQHLEVLLTTSGGPPHIRDAQHLEGRILLCFSHKHSFISGLLSCSGRQVGALSRSSSLLFLGRAFVTCADCVFVLPCCFNAAITEVEVIRAPDAASYDHRAWPLWTSGQSGWSFSSPVWSTNSVHFI